MTKKGENRVGEDLRKAHFQTIYWCDPEKNTECRKADCCVDGGDCRITSRRSCAMTDGGMPMVAKVLRIEGRRTR